MTKILERLEKEISKGKYAKAVEEIEVVLNEVNGILRDHYVVRKERKFFKNIKEYLHRLQFAVEDLPPSLKEKAMSIAFAIDSLLQHELTIAETQEQVKKIKSVALQLANEDLIQQDAEVKGSFERIINFFDHLIDDSVVFSQKYIGKLQFPITIQEPVKIHLVGSYTIKSIIVEWETTKKFVAITPEDYSHLDDDVQFSGFEYESNLELSSILEYNHGDGEPQYRYLKYGGSETERFLDLQCIPPELKAKYLNLKTQYNDKLHEFNKLREWMKSAKCNVQLEKKFADTEEDTEVGH